MNTTLTGYVSIRDRTIAEIRSDGSVYVRSAQNRPVSHFDTQTRATKIGRVDVAAKSVQLPSGEQLGYLEGNSFISKTGELGGVLVREDFLYLGAPTANSDYVLWRILDTHNQPVGFVMGLAELSKLQNRGVLYAAGAALLVLHWLWTQE